MHKIKNPAFQVMSGDSEIELTGITLLSTEGESQPEPRFSTEMTLKDIQEAINTSHPFGIRLWKPALYKKERGIDRASEAAVHSLPTPTHTQEYYFYIGNIMWTLMFGWWMALVYILLAALLYSTVVANQYASLFVSMAGYSFWPFGKYIQRSTANSSSTRLDDCDESGEREPLMGTSKSSSIVFSVIYWLVLFPLHASVSLMCWFLVVSVPMAKLNWVLLQNLRNRPLDLQARSGSKVSGEIILCTFRAIGWRYYKYTYEGINIIIINLAALVIFSIIDDKFIAPAIGHQYIGHPMFIFICCILSIMPLAYYIGMSVSSISAQSSFGFGSVVNATFGSIVEIILYCFAIKDGKGELVEGGIVGSFLGSMLLLPGLSMIAGSFKLKEQRFNSKSAGVSSTMLILAMIGSLIPTLFYHIYGKYNITCDRCESMENCFGCKYTLMDPNKDAFYISKIKPLMYFCAAVLPSAYLIGLFFTLRTHSGHIYERKPLNENEEARQQNPHQSSYDAPNWSKKKSAVVLLVSTILFALIAEIIVDNIDPVLKSTGISERFLGVTLMALAPSFTEFLNAIAFSMQGNIELSLEIGSAYALQVALLQIPALVLFSAIYNRSNENMKNSFTLIFPQYDVITIFLSIFLLNYTYNEGNSNYFKGAILTLSYAVLLAPFALA